MNKEGEINQKTLKQLVFSAVNYTEEDRGTAIVITQDGLEAFKIWLIEKRQEFNNDKKRECQIIKGNTCILDELIEELEHG